MSDELRFLVPSRGRIGEQTLDFLAACGLEVVRPNERQYLASLPAAPGVTVLFQRARQLVEQVRNGDADVGITGLDIFSEERQDGDDLFVIVENLGYARARLAIAVPENWIDVQSLTDLAEVAIEFREAGRPLRIATTFPRLTREFLFAQGITHFHIVQAEGGVEAAPSLGYADIIVDLVSTGTTLRENHLKVVGNGVILRTQACLIGNRPRLRQSQAKRLALRRLLELIEAHLRAAQYSALTANMRGMSPETVAKKLADFPELSGLLGPTVAQVFPSPRSTTEGESWYAVTLMVKSSDLLRAVDCLRQAGCHSVSVSPPRYIFGATCTFYAEMLKTLGIKDDSELPERRSQT